MTEYLKHRNTLFNGTCDSKFVKNGKSIKVTHKDTLPRWTKEIMRKSGMNISVFKPHNCRGAYSSAAKNAGVPIEDTLK